MTITEFIDKLRPPSRRWADLVQSASLAMLLVLVRYGWSLVNANWGNQLTVLEWPMACSTWARRWLHPDGAVRRLGRVSKSRAARPATNAIRKRE